MICYRDTTYCCSPNCRNECGRQFTEADKIDAKRWWGKDGAPIAMAEFCDKNGERIDYGRR